MYPILRIRTESELELSSAQNDSLFLPEYRFQRRRQLLRSLLRLNNRWGATLVFTVEQRNFILAHAAGKASGEPARRMRMCIDWSRLMF